MEGYFKKYIVSKANGEPVDPEAEYFVLRLDTDSKAREALDFYAELIKKDNTKLNEELKEKLLDMNLKSSGYYSIKEALPPIALNVLIIQDGKKAIAYRSSSSSFYGSIHNVEYSPTHWKLLTE